MEPTTQTQPNSTNQHMVPTHSS